MSTTRVQNFGMNSTKLRNMINISTAICLIVAAGVAIWGWTTMGQIAMKPINLEPLRATQPTLAKPSSESPQHIAGAKDIVHSDVWRRSLQSGFRAMPIVPKIENKPSLPPPPSPPQPTKAVPTDFGLRLVGTVLEKGRSMAIAVDRLGKLDFCLEGAELRLEPPGIRVDSIDTEAVTVFYQGKSVSWLMGQSLRIDGISEQPASMVPIAPIAPIPQDPKQTKPKMSIEEELELINGNGDPVPL